MDPIPGTQVPDQAGAVANFCDSTPQAIPSAEHPNIIELRGDALPEDTRKTLYKHLSRKLTLPQYIQFYHLINPDQATLDQQVDQLMEWHNWAPEDLQAIINTQNTHLDRAFRTMVPAGMKQNTKDYPSPSLIVKYYLTIQLASTHRTSGGASTHSSHPWRPTYTYSWRSITFTQTHSLPSLCPHSRARNSRPSPLRMSFPCPNYPQFQYQRHSGDGHQCTIKNHHHPHQ